MKGSESLLFLYTFYIWTPWTVIVLNLQPFTIGEVILFIFLCFLLHWRLLQVGFWAPVPEVGLVLHIVLAKLHGSRPKGGAVEAKEGKEKVLLYP